MLAKLFSNKGMAIVQIIGGIATALEGIAFLVGEKLNAKEPTAEDGSEEAQEA